MNTKPKKYVDPRHVNPVERAAAIDAHVGRRVKQRRVALGMSEEDLARVLNTTGQQVMKYEAGDNRISCGRLYELSRALDVPILWFFIGAPGVDLSPDLKDVTLADLLRSLSEG